MPLIDAILARWPWARDVISTSEETILFSRNFVMRNQFTFKVPLTEPGYTWTGIYIYTTEAASPTLDTLEFDVEFYNTANNIRTYVYAREELWRRTYGLEGGMTVSVTMPFHEQYSGTVRLLSQKQTL